MTPKDAFLTVLSKGAFVRLENDKVTCWNPNPKQANFRLANCEQMVRQHYDLLYRYLSTPPERPRACRCGRLNRYARRADGRWVCVCSFQEAQAS